MKRQDLPIFKGVVDDSNSTGVEFVSLVSEPAIEVNWVAMKKNEEAKPMFFADAEKQMLYGPLMIPNILIYRNDEQGEYNMFFDAQTIEKISEKFMANENTRNINVEHVEGSQISAVLVESWITQTPDKSKKFGFNLPDGTWFGGVKIKDAAFWTEFVKTGTVKGFSIEGMIKLEKSQKPKQSKMEKVTEVALEVSAKDKDGNEIFASEWKVGADIYTKDANGANVPYDGTTVLESGETVVAKAGKITDIQPATPAAAPAAPASQAPVAGEAETKAAKMALAPEDLAQITDLLTPIIEAVSALNDRVTALEGGTPAGQSADTEMKAYPWDQCMADAVARYGSKEIAAKVCAAIKNGTVNHSAEEVKNTEVKVLVDTIKELEEKIAKLSAAPATTSVTAAAHTDEKKETPKKGLDMDRIQRLIELRRNNGVTKN